MRLVFFGGGGFGIPALQLLAQTHDIRQVFCPPPRPAGRKMRATNCALSVAAAQMALPISEGKITAAEVRAHSPQAMIVCDYGHLLSPEILQCAPLGALNIHPSLLPQWRGAAPIVRAILSGDAHTGVSVMQMDAGLDTGDILLQESLAIVPPINGGELSAVLSDMGARLLLRALQNKPLPRAQDSGRATYATKIVAAERDVDFCDEAATLVRQVRAFAPMPGVRAMWGGHMIKIIAAHEVAVGGAPGAVLAAGDEGIVVGCGKNALALTRLQQAGKKMMAVGEFVRGLRDNMPKSFLIGNGGKVGLPR